MSWNGKDNYFQKLQQDVKKFEERKSSEQKSLQLSRSQITNPPDNTIQTEAAKNRNTIMEFVDKHHGFINSDIEEPFRETLKRHLEELDKPSKSVLGPYEIDTPTDRRELITDSNKGETSIESSETVVEQFNYNITHREESYYTTDQIPIKVTQQNNPSTDILSRSIADQSQEVTEDSDDHIKKLPADIVQDLITVRSHSMASIKSKREAPSKATHTQINLNIEEILLQCRNATPRIKTHIRKRREKDDIKSSGIKSLSEALNNLDTIKKGNIGGKAFNDVIDAIKGHIDNSKF